MPSARRSAATPIPGSFADRLREKRLGQGITQADLARHLGVPRSQTIGDWERGGLPKATYHETLVRYLGLPGRAALLELLDGQSRDGAAGDSEVEVEGTVHDLFPSPQARPQTSVPAAQVDSFVRAQMAYFEERLADGRLTKQEMEALTALNRLLR